jgi:hypothetical protein
MENGLAVAEGFEPSHGRINSAVPYQLGYATKNLGWGDWGNGEGETKAHWSYLIGHIPFSILKSLSGRPNLALFQPNLLLNEK